MRQAIVIAVLASLLLVPSSSAVVHLPYGHAQTVQCLGNPALGGVCHEFALVSSTTSCVYEANETYTCVVTTHLQQQVTGSDACATVTSRLVKGAVCAHHEWPHASGARTKDTFAYYNLTAEGANWVEAGKACLTNAHGQTTCTPFHVFVNLRPTDDVQAPGLVVPGRDFGCYPHEETRLLCVSMDEVP